MVFQNKRASKTERTRTTYLKALQRVGKFVLKNALEQETRGNNERGAFLRQLVVEGKLDPARLIRSTDHNGHEEVSKISRISWAVFSPKECSNVWNVWHHRRPQLPQYQHRMLHKSGTVDDLYMKYGVAGDQFSGRVLCGLPVHSSRFAVLLQLIHRSSPILLFNLFE